MAFNGFILFLSFLFPLIVANAAETKTCGSKEGFSFCYYPGDPGSTRLVYFFHGYGDDEKSWDRQAITKTIDGEWRKARALRPHVVNVSRGKWWYTEKKHGEKLVKFSQWFEQRFNFTPERALYGESMGGHNAYRWALDHPQMFTRLALTCPAFPKMWVKDAPHTQSGWMEGFAETLIWNNYRRSSQPDFNPLLHSPNENPENQIKAVFVLASKDDEFGFYDGDLAIQRTLNKNQMSVTAEDLKVPHCKHNTAGLAKFLSDEQVVLPTP